MLHDELERIHIRQNDLKIDLAKFKLEEKEIQNALQGLRSDRSHGMKLRQEEATLLERLKEVCGSITLYKETLLSLEEEEAYITCEIRNNENVLKENMKYVPLEKVSLQVESDLPDMGFKVQNTSDSTVDKTPEESTSINNDDNTTTIKSVSQMAELTERSMKIAEVNLRNIEAKRLKDMHEIEMLKQKEERLIREREKLRAFTVSKRTRTDRDNVN